MIFLVILIGFDLPVLQSTGESTKTSMEKSPGNVYSKVIKERFN